jgi:CheY-like chemotaxis protein
VDKIKALVVDDLTTSRLLLRHILTRGADYDVRTADCGEQALQMMEEELPDVILLDVNMPGMSGSEVLRKIRERWTDRVKVIVVSGSRAPKVVRKMLGMGVCGYILKPVDPDDVLFRVQRMVEKS